MFFYLAKVRVFISILIHFHFHSLLSKAFLACEGEIFSVFCLAFLACEGEIFPVFSVFHYKSTRVKAIKFAKARSRFRSFA